MMPRPAWGLALALALSTVVVPATGDELGIPPSDIRVVPGKDDCIELWIKKTPARGAVLLIEANESGSPGFVPYTLRSPGYDPVNGNEVRILEGRRYSGAEAGFSLVDSSPEPHAELGQAFHIRIPHTVSFGYASGRNGTLTMVDGARFAIRTFALPGADYAGAYADSPYMVRLIAGPPVAVAPPPQPAPVIVPPVQALARVLKPAVFVMPQSLPHTTARAPSKPSAVPQLHLPELPAASTLRRPVSYAGAAITVEPVLLPLPELAAQLTPPSDLDGLSHLRDEMARLYLDTALLVAQSKLASGDSTMLYDLFDSGKLGYEALFESLDISIRNNIENGYIIDPRNLEDIVVYVSKIFRYSASGGIKDGDRAFVFRGEEEPIGYIKFSKSGDRSVVALVELASSTTPIQPFDKIIFDLK